VTKAKAEAACPGCGFAAGRQACQDLFNDAALRVRALAWTGSLATWRLMHDVYAIQHVEDRCTGYGQFVMHLGGVCVALEHNGAERSYRQLQKFSERDEWKAKPFPPPDLPAARGAFTASSLAKFDEPMLLMDGVDRWARSAWVAYEPMHSTAREWVSRAHEQAQAQSQ
jgi:hypothetical protein